MVVILNPGVDLAYVHSKVRIVDVKPMYCLLKVDVANAVGADIVVLH